jgi:hypothetical protein
MTRLPTTEEMLAEARAGVWPSPHHEPRLHWHALRDILLFIGMEAKRLDVSIGDHEPGQHCQNARVLLEDAHAELVLMCHRLDEAEERRDAA